MWQNFIVGSICSYIALYLGEAEIYSDKQNLLIVAHKKAS
jgi:hypothetical protein